MQGEPIPSAVRREETVILFDGVCKLCSLWCLFIIKYDTYNHFKLASVQSPEGKELLRYFDYSQDVFNTMLLIEGSVCYEKSDAFFNVVKKLKLPWKCLVVFRVVPRLMRDWVYDKVALNRYKLFGRYKACELPKADNNRYL